MRPISKEKSATFLDYFPICGAIGSKAAFHPSMGFSKPRTVDHSIKTTLGTTNDPEHISQNGRRRDTYLHRPSIVKNDPHPPSKPLADRLNTCREQSSLGAGLINIESRGELWT